MRRGTPNRFASVEHRPPFSTSTNVSATRSMTPNTPARRAVSPSASTLNRQRQQTAQPMFMPQQRGVSQATGSARRSPPVDETFGVMLSDLVHLSHNIERYISENPNALQPGAGGAASPPQALKADEIERVVRRVEGHFQGKMSQLEHLVQEQKESIAQLTKERDMWKRRATEGGGSATPVTSTQSLGEAVRSSIATRSAALSELEKTWNDDEPAQHAPAHGKRDQEIHQLRQILLEEKRQRLLVEEQTQSLTEQHSKVVHTLEQRIRKQEKQLQVIMDAFEQQQGNGTLSALNNSANNASTSDDGNLRGTPRSLKFRQRQLRHEDHTPELPPHASSTLPPNQQQSSHARCESTDITDIIEMSNKVLNGNENASSNGGDSAAPVTLTPDAAMDDVAMFLANISRELESINDLERQRQTKLAGLS